MREIIKLIGGTFLFLSLLVPAEVKAVKMGVVLPLSGEFALEAKCALQCVEMAIEDANRAGGKAIKLVSYDDSSTVSGAVRAAEALCRDDEVIAVVGHYNDWCTQASAPLYNKYKLVALSPASISSLLSESGPYIFRICPNDEYQGGFIARDAVKRWKNIAIIYDDNLYGRGLKYFFYREVKAKGANVLTALPYTRGIDLSPVGGADVVFIACGPVAAISVCEGLKGIGNIYKLGSDGMSTQRFRGWARSNALGVEHFTYLDTTRKEIKTFIDRYVARYGIPPGDCGILSYDAANLIISSLSYGKTRESVKDYLTSLGKNRKPFRGLTGVITFNSNGEATRNSSIGEIVEERAVVVIEETPLEPLEKPQFPSPTPEKEVNPEESPETKVSAPEFVAYDEAPRVKKMTYPKYLKQRQIECSGILSLTIDTTGIVTKAKMLRSDAPDWVNKIIIEEAMKWEFYPAKQRDKPVKVTVAYPFKFEIK
jgi:branched-chain amino acid transport system substrate-binding protein